MQIEVKLSLPDDLAGLTGALVEVADNQKKIEALHLANQQLLASVAQQILDASTPETVTSASPPVVQAGE